jgi:hypothetical protein
MIKLEFANTIGQWTYICCYCLVQIETGSGVHTTGPQCAACQNTNLRFVHVLEHMEDSRQIEVGIECARMLVDRADSKIPRLAENETKRKEMWRVRYRKVGRCVTTVSHLIERGKL